MTADRGTRPFCRPRQQRSQVSSTSSTTLSLSPELYDRWPLSEGRRCERVFTYLTGVPEAGAVCLPLILLDTALLSSPPTLVFLYGKLLGRVANGLVLTVSTRLCLTPVGAAAPGSNILLGSVISSELGLRSPSGPPVGVLPVGEGRGGFRATGLGRGRPLGFGGGVGEETGRGMRDLAFIGLDAGVPSGVLLNISHLCWSLLNLPPPHLELLAVVVEPWLEPTEPTEPWLDEPVQPWFEEPV
uniref:Uncharacterized protein n=1 Tax=Cacopsylla melanoneura TaxID=428564 RepID=A0A8D8UKJ6_9HEMI